MPDAYLTRDSKLLISTPTVSAQLFELTNDTTDFLWSRTASIHQRDLLGDSTPYTVATNVLGAIDINGFVPETDYRLQEFFTQYAHQGVLVIDWHPPSDYVNIGRFIPSTVQMLPDDGIFITNISMTQSGRHFAGKARDIDHGDRWAVTGVPPRAWGFIYHPHTADTRIQATYNSGGKQYTIDLAANSYMVIAQWTEGGATAKIPQGASSGEIVVTTPDDPAGTANTRDAVVGYGQYIQEIGETNA